jgi:hypothetical protein
MFYNAFQKRKRLLRDDDIQLLGDGYIQWIVFRTVQEKKEITKKMKEKRYIILLSPSSLTIEKYLFPPYTGY